MGYEKSFRNEAWEWKEKEDSEIFTRKASQWTISIKKVNEKLQRQIKILKSKIKEGGNVKKYWKGV